MAASNKRIDVLIPHYRDADGLRLTLASIRSQTWDGELRVVIADDGSPVEIKSAMREVVASYSEIPIELIENKGNRGRPYTRNALLDSIDSPYCAWLDAGDEWYRKKLEVQFATLEEAESAGKTMFWVTCNYDWLWQGGRPRKIVQHVTDPVRDLLVGRRLRAYLWTLLSPSSAMKAAGPFDLKLPRLQDLDFFLRFAEAGGEFLKPAEGDALCVYHKSDVGRSADEVRACNSYIYNKHRNSYDQFGDRFRKARLYEMELLSARLAIKNGSGLHAARYMSRALRHKPFSFAKRLLTKGLKI